MAKRIRRRALAVAASLALASFAARAEGAYQWRGLMLDESRHFFGKAVVMRILDRMAGENYNVFHWHLADHQGWRIEIRRYPELTRLASVRDVAEWRRLRTEGWIDPDTEKYGPYFYSQADIREIVAYAATRGITIVPEIEIPGHCRAILKARPSLQCENVAEKLDEVERGYRNAVVCAGSDEVIKFYEDVIDEVCELFPSKVVHLGGDEVKTVFWKYCPKCQARIRSEKLADEKALKGWLMRRFESYLASKGRRLGGWDEILDDGLTTNAVIFCWRGGDIAARASEKGYDVVQCPEEYCYFDFRQGIVGDGHEYHPRGNKVFPPLTIEKVRSFDPLAGIPASCRGHVLGAQANNWTELTLDEESLMWKMWPRATALSEVLGKGGRSLTLRASPAVAGGISFLLFALFYWVIDVLNFRKWTFFFTVIGMNSITIYMAQRVIGFRVARDFLFGGLASLFPEAWSPVVLQIGYIAVCWLFLYFLHRKGVYLKV